MWAPGVSPVCRACSDGMDSSCLCGIIVPSRTAFWRPRQGGVRMEHTTIAVDLTKSVFQVAVSSHHGSVDTERRLSRDRFLTYFAQQPPATIVMEACGSAHHWARQLQ